MKFFSVITPDRHRARFITPYVLARAWAVGYEAEHGVAVEVVDWSELPDSMRPVDPYNGRQLKPTRVPRVRSRLKSSPSAVSPESVGAGKPQSTGYGVSRRFYDE